MGTAGRHRNVTLATKVLDISQGSVATCLRSGGIFNDDSLQT